MNKKKRICRVLAVLVMICCCFSSIYSMKLHATATESTEETVKNSEMSGTRSLKPFVAYEAFMTGAGNLFRPNDALTRGEAVIAISKLLVDEDDVQGVYESEFLDLKDLKESDPNYSIYAYMEKCGFLPDFGKELLPNQAISRREFAILLLGEPNPEVSNPDAAISRAEAAKEICKYIGKTSDEFLAKATKSRTTQFSDIAGDSNEDYIVLATTAIAPAEVTYEAADGKELQEQVVKAIDCLKNASEDTKAIITLTGDIYNLSKSIDLSKLDNVNGCEVSIEFKAAALTEKSPVITSSKDISGANFKQVEGKNYYSYQFTEDDMIGGAWPKFRDLYVNGERLELARSEKYTFGETYRDGTNNCFYVNSDSIAGVDSGDVSPLEFNVNMMWLHKIYHVDSIVKDIAEPAGCSSIALSKGAYQQFVIADNEDNQNQSVKANLQGFEYWFTNHLALLDQPGEFFYDELTGKLYVYPYEDYIENEAIKKGINISYPVAERLFYLDDAENVSFEGITFTGTTFNFTTKYGYNSFQGAHHIWNEVSRNAFMEELGITETYNGEIGKKLEDKANEFATVGAIVGKGVNHLSVKNCIFDDLGGAGINLKGSNQDVIIIDNSFTDLAMSAICLGDRSQTEQSFQKNVIIENNYIDDVSKDYRTYPGVIVFSYEDIAITHNTITRTPYSGIHLGWFTTEKRPISGKRAEIAYNKLENNMYAGDDGAAIYVVGAVVSDTADTEIYNYIHHNFVRANGYVYWSNTRPYNWSVNPAIYLDDSSSNYCVYENVMTSYQNKAIGSIYVQHGSDKEARNNLIKNNYSTMYDVCATYNVDDEDGPEVNVLNAERRKNKNIQLSGNETYRTIDDLPVKAQNIMKEAGANVGIDGAPNVYQSRGKMEIKVTLNAESYMRLLCGKVSPNDSLTFTITNHGASDNTYKITSNDASGQVSMPQNVTVGADETKNIPVSFQAGDANIEKLLDFTVTDQHGRREFFDRLLTLRVFDNYGNEIPKCSSFDGSSEATDYYADGMILTATSSAMTYTRTSDLSSLTSGMRADIRPINRSGAIALQFGGYTISYAADGMLSIGGVEQSVEKQMKAISEVSKISVYIKQTEDSSSAELVVDVYDLESRLCGRFSNDKMPTPTSGFDKKPAFTVAANDKYRVSYLGGADKLIVGDVEKNETQVPVYVADKELLPIGTLDTGDSLLYVRGWDLNGSDYEVYRSTQMTESPSLTQDLIDCKMLGIKWQLLENNTSQATASEDDEKHMVRFLGSVNGVDGYRNVGIILSPTHGVEPMKGDGASDYREFTTVYDQIQAGGHLLVASEVYDAYTKHLFGRVFTGVPDKQPVSVRAYVTLLDGTVVYGRTRQITVEDCLTFENKGNLSIENYEDLWK